MTLTGKRLIVVLGMHRCGTSVITRGLNVLGVDLGENLMLPVAGDNPKGYFEDLDINALNIEMLQALGSDWSCLATIEPDGVDNLFSKGFFLRAVEMLRQKTINVPILGFKDPRTAKLLPFWKQVFEYCGFDMSYVLVTRNPLSVVRSLEKRSGFSPEKIYLLWLEHILISLSCTENTKRILIDFDNFIASPQQNLERIGEQFSFQININELQIYQAEFIDEKLRHTTYELSDLSLDRACPPLILEVYSELNNVANNNGQIDAKSFCAQISRWVDEFNRLKFSLRWIDTLTHEAEERDREVIRKQERICQLSEDLKKQAQNVQKLDKGLQEAQSTICKLKQENSDFSKWWEDLDADLKSARAIITNLNEELTSRSTWGLGLLDELDKARKKLDRIAEYASQNLDFDLQLLLNNCTLMKSEDVFLSHLPKSKTDKAQNLAELLQYHDRQFIECAYLTLLGRHPDITGMKYYLGRLQSGVSKIQILDQILSSTEGKRSSANLPGLRTAIQRFKLSKIPLIKVFFKQFGQSDTFLSINDRLSSVEQKMFALNQHTDSYMQHLEQSINNLKNSVPLSLSHVALPHEGSKKVINTKTDALALKIPKCLHPQVSVIIPVYGQIEFTIRCLQSISNHLPLVPFEVIVIDDCSPDKSQEILCVVEGIRLITNTVNLGFIRSCNRGAEEAFGEYLCFLNNDTEVTAGWLDELFRTFVEMPGTGLVGSKLLNPDGTLQEAGGIIWNDGSAWNFGRNQDPSLPIYNYAREVDYCSGASIMVPSQLFFELGGFDEHYLPAYCEDSDLALKIRDHGYRVIYQPLSVVVHFEGVTSGKDVSTGVKSYQVENMRKVFERWKERLQNHQPNGGDVDRAKDRTAMRRVLVLDHCTPTPNKDSGSIDALNIMLLLRDMGFQVTFIPEDNYLFMPDYTPDLQRVGIEVLYAPHCTSVKQHIQSCGNRYDLVFLFRVGVVERNITDIRKNCKNAKVIFHTVDLHHIRMAREAELYNDKNIRKVALDMKMTELSAIASADLTTMISETEFVTLQAELPKERIRLLPYSRAIRGSNKAFGDRKDVTFVGGYQHTPNIDAVKYFVTEVMPILRELVPGVKFNIVGSNMPSDFSEYTADDIVLVGFVDDLNQILDKTRVSVAPLRYGAGIKGKIGSAMAVGLPTVATPLAAEGMSLTNRENIIIASGAKEFAAAIAELYQDEVLWNRLSQNGLDFAEKAWGAEAAWEKLSQVLADIDMSITKSNHPIRLYSPDIATECSTNYLKPVGVFRSRHEYEQISQSRPIGSLVKIQNNLIKQLHGQNSFTVSGYCIPCNKSVPFLVDRSSGAQQQGNGWIPNWRERQVCPSCQMNSRQRLISAIVSQYLRDCQSNNLNVYFMEQVTPIYDWATKSFPAVNIIGSEFLGPQYASGTVRDGILHEDVMALSFEDNSLDLIVSNDVFEHVPVPSLALRECFRVLKPNGLMIVTIPFHCNSDASVTRATIDSSGITHKCPPLYHGNPVSADGSLVITDFGWDFMDMLSSSGFEDIWCEVYASKTYGHLGGMANIIFKALKRKSETEINLSKITFLKDNPPPIEKTSEAASSETAVTPIHADYQFIGEVTNTKYLKALESFPLNPAVMIELNSKCNFYCNYCRSPQSKRQKSFMDPKLFRHLLPQLSEITTQPIRFHIDGEPTLHPNFLELALETNLAGHKIALATNGSNLKKEFLQIDMGVLVNISCSEDELENRSSMNFSSYKSKLAQYVKDWMEFESTQTIEYKIYTSALERTDSKLINQKQQFARDLISNLGIYEKVTITGEEPFQQFSYQKQSGGRFVLSFQPLTEGGLYPDVSGNVPVTPQTLSVNGYCDSPWKVLAVLSDGAVCFCCVDVTGETAYTEPNEIWNTNLKELWLNHPKVLKIREQLLSGKVSLPICRQCLSVVPNNEQYLFQEIFPYEKNDAEKK